MFKLSKLSKKLLFIPLSATLITCLLPSVFAQSVNRKPSSQNKAPFQVVSDKPWLVTIVHEVNLSEIEKSLLQRGIKMNLSSDKLINFVPINVTTGIVLDKQGHILTRLVNLNPEAGEKGIGTINVMLPSGEERQARFVGLDGPSGFCLLEVENLNIAPARLANQLSLNSNIPVTLLNVEFGDKPTNKQQDKLDRLRQFSRKLLSQSTKIIQFANIGFFNISFSNSFADDSSLSFGVVLNQNREIIGIPENFQNNSMKVFSASEAYRAAKRIMDRQGNVPRAWFGIGGIDASNLNPEKIAKLNLPQSKGVYISSVFPNSPAEIYGLRKDDVILTLNNEPVELESDLSSFVALQPAGEVLDIGVWRNNELKNYQVILGSRGYKSPFVIDKTEEQAQIYSKEQELKSVESALDVFQKEFQKLRTENKEKLATDPSLEKTLGTIKTLEMERKKLLRDLNRFPYAFGDSNPIESFLGVKVEDLPDPPPNPDPTKVQRFPHGVRVLEVFPNSLAARTGVKVGDVLTQITSFLIDNKDYLKAILPLVRLSSALSQNTLVLTREDQKLTLEMPLPKKLPRVNSSQDGYILTEEVRKKLEAEKLNLPYTFTFIEVTPPK
jgi:S1-C subfamily serine protease